MLPVVKLKCLTDRRAPLKIISQSVLVIYNEEDSYKVPDVTWEKSFISSLRYSENFTNKNIHHNNLCSKGPKNPIAQNSSITHKTNFNGPFKSVIDSISYV